MTRSVQIVKAFDGALTRVTDGGKVWSRKYFSLMEACRDAASMGLVLPAEAKAAYLSGAGLKLSCAFIDLPALVEGGFEVA